MAIETIKNYNKRGDYWLAEYVVMPDHIHLLICPYKKDLSECIHNLKRTIAHEIGKLEKGWQADVIAVAIPSVGSSVIEQLLDESSKNLLTVVAGKVCYDRFLPG